KGTWTGNPTPTYTYQWKRCDTAGNNCATITGATHTSYTLATAKAGAKLQVTVTAKNSVGSASANSAATAVVTSVASAPVNTAGSASASSAATAVVSSGASAPVNTALPAVSGQTEVGQILTATTGTWTGSPTPTYTYQWKRCDTTGSNCTTITGATQSSYTL